MTNNAEHSNGPIDFVVTWVDSDSVEWRSLRDRHLTEAEQGFGVDLVDWVSGPQRFRDWHLLRYWFRAVESFAPWVHRVYLVTAGECPPWLNLEYNKVRLVTHEEFIPADYLPTFNSHTIELNLHRIPGLSQQFVYFNDDMFLMRPTKETDFFLDGLPRDFAGLAAPTLSRHKTIYGPFNAMVINDHFDKREMVIRNLSKWINPLYGLKCNLETIALLPFRQTTGFQTDHLPISFLRSTFEEVWSKEERILDRSCRDRFRGFFGVSPWLMRDWQRASGNFVPIAPEFNGLVQCGDNPGKKELARVSRRIRHSRKRMICLCDYCSSNEDFELWCHIAQNAFECLLPQRSSFEIEGA